MKIETNNILPFVLVGGIALFIGYQFKENEKRLANEAGQTAINEAGKYIKSEVDVAKDWFNQLGNTWKQIWK